MKGNPQKRTFWGIMGTYLNRLSWGSVAEWNEYEMLVVAASELMAKQAKMIIKSAY